MTEELRKALELARRTILRDRAALYACHYDPKTGEPNAAGRAGMAEYDVVLATIHDALAASAQSGWRPISEAPKDGTKLLLWATRNTMLVPTPEVVSGWYANGWWSDEATLSHVTDWQPLPAAPRSSV